MAVILKTFGTSASRLVTEMSHLPVTPKASSSADGLPIAPATLAMSTETSNVPRMPVSSILTPLSVCVWLGVPPGVAGPEPPKASEAVLAPMPIVAISLPSLNVVPTRPIVKPSSVSGPRPVGPAVPPVSVGRAVDREVAERACPAGSSCRPLLTHQLARCEFAVGVPGTTQVLENGLLSVARLEARP